MTGDPQGNQARTSARALLVDDADRLVLIKRVKPHTAAYWTTPGGRVEPSDRSTVTALHRELREELGANAVVGAEVYVQEPTGAHPSRQHFHVARLSSLDASLRSGPDVDAAARGESVVERVDVAAGGVDAIDLRPPGLAAFVRAEWPGILGQARRLV
ncbi:NUDIX domain-containing protein [Haloactinopolyspora alba]|uniref:NUDIX domain-containing protein n=1 Tax=Haloactinopolyspora alba TaxID=648780 RepID=A0A2P8EG87_9ACTN|nr:NUDIX hydrolase [Haloactinopolyspora alba]PSL08476.1 NUDIX domain-containing protein [Haloactinopolyspora alba]